MLDELLLDDEPAELLAEELRELGSPRPDTPTVGMGCLNSVPFRGHPAKSIRLANARSGPIDGVRRLWARSRATFRHLPHEPAHSG